VATSCAALRASAPLRKIRATGACPRPSNTPPHLASKGGVTLRCAVLFCSDLTLPRCHPPQAPEWDARSRCYALDFPGRSATVSRTSSLWRGTSTRARTTRVIGDDTFALDFAAPMSALSGSGSAFAVALASGGTHLCHAL
jgi:hypothetical protein